MNKSLDDIIYNESKSFLVNLLMDINIIQININSLLIDHICYRVSSGESYYYYKNELLAFGTLLSESIIANRPIATFKLHQPIIIQERKIFLFELPSPKPGSPYPDGYEHIEIVIDTSLENWIERYPHLPFNTKGLSKSFNRDIKLKLPSGTVKFHEQSLEAVIAQERSL